MSRPAGSYSSQSVRLKIHGSTQHFNRLRSPPGGHCIALRWMLTSASVLSDTTLRRVFTRSRETTFISYLRTSEKGITAFLRSVGPCCRTCWEVSCMHPVRLLPCVWKPHVGLWWEFSQGTCRLTHSSTVNASMLPQNVKKKKKKLFMHTLVSIQPGCLVLVNVKHLRPAVLRASSRGCSNFGSGRSFSACESSSNSRNRSKCWRRFHRRDASSGTLNTSLSGGAFSRRTGGVFLSWIRKKARVPFTMRQAVVFETSLNYLLMKLNNGYLSSLLVIACDYQPLY